ncbi:MAG: recombinase family protein [Planctomycetota bacterium]
MEIIAYTRVSTESQGKHGVSLPAQERRIRAGCEQLGHVLVAVYTDVASGKNLRRPGLQEALRHLKKRPEAGLMVTALDRLSRSVRDILKLVDESFSPERYGSRGFVSLAQFIDTTTPFGRFALTQWAALAQLEREQTSHRVKLALAHKRLHGERAGTVPWGWRLARGRKKIEPNMAELLILTKAAELRRQGMSLRKIGEALAHAGHVNRKGRRVFNPKTVRSILESARRWREDQEHAAVLEKFGYVPAEAPAVDVPSSAEPELAAMLLKFGYAPVTKE